MSRLPDFAASVNKKLGGPSAHSPEKKRRNNEAKTPAAARKRPGEAVDRVALQKKHRQSLGRSTTDVTDSKPGPSRHPSLSRSATDSLALPGIKREDSLGPTLKDIPLASSASTAAAKVKRFAQRSVDFAAMTATNAAKIKRKKQIENDLRDAIGTLKKPNRGAAVKEFVESSDQRRLVGHQHKRNNVLVTATPKKGRPAHSVLQEADLGLLDPLAEGMSDPVIPSSAIRSAPGSAIVPGSVIRRSFGDRLHPSAATNAGIAETPSRASTKPISFAGSVSSFRFAVGQQQDALPQTPPKVRREQQPHTTGLSSDMNAVFATPQRISSVRSTSVPAEDLDTNKKHKRDDHEELDIYKTLGWDDDVDDLA